METLKKGITSLLLSLFLGLVTFGIRYFGVNDQISILIATTVVIISLIFFLTIYRSVMRKISLSFLKDELKTSDEKGKKFKLAVSNLVVPQEIPAKVESSDIVRTYSSFSECESKIAEEIKNAHTIKLFTNVGRDDFTKGNNYYDAIVQNQQNGQFRFLIADPESPFVSEAWARKRRPTKEAAQEAAQTWGERIRVVVKEGKLLNSRNRIDIKIKGHRYPFIWHYWIIDDRAYISAFLKPTRNYFTMKVFELKRLDPNQGEGLYEMFNTYFDRVWEEQAYEFDE